MDKSGTNIPVVCIFGKCDDEYDAAVNMLKVLTGDILVKTKVTKVKFRKGNIPVKSGKSTVQICIFKIYADLNEYYSVGLIIDELKPKWVFKCGLCAGRRDKLHVGDIAIMDFIRYSCDHKLNDMFNFSRRANARWVDHVNSILSNNSLQTISVRPIKDYSWRLDEIIKILANSDCFDIEQDQLFKKHGKDIFDNDKEILQAVKGLFNSMQPSLVKIDGNIWTITTEGLNQMHKIMDRWGLPIKSKQKYIRGSMIISNESTKNVPKFWKKVDTYLNSAIGMNTIQTGFLCKDITNAKHKCDVLIVNTVESISNAYNDYDFSECNRELLSL